jgi:acyl-CoA dehydrogenase
MHAQAASLVRWQAASLFDAGKPSGAETNAAKLLASEAAWEAAEVAMTVHGGSGMAVEMGIERNSVKRGSTWWRR